jgi:hypothetical protein
MITLYIVMCCVVRWWPVLVYTAEILYNLISIRFYSVLQFIRYQCLITAFK